MDRNARFKSGGFILFVIGIILTISIVFSQHQTSIDGNSVFYVNEDVVNLYNISVFNNDSGENASITGVNVTIGSDISFFTGSQAKAIIARITLNNEDLSSKIPLPGFTINTKR